MGGAATDTDDPDVNVDPAGSTTASVGAAVGALPAFGCDVVRQSDGAAAEAAAAAEAVTLEWELTDAAPMSSHSAAEVPTTAIAGLEVLGISLDTVS